MTTRKFKILCDGQFIGFIFIGENNPQFPNLIIGTIWPFERKGNWTLGDLELVGKKAIHDIYENGTSDEDIQNDLLRQANILKTICKNFQIMLY